MNWRVAAIQMASGPVVEGNLTEAAGLIKTAVEHGAQFVALPEFFAIMGMSDTDMLKAAERDGEGPMQDFLRKQAREHGIWLLGGTIPIKTSRSSSRVRAASLLLDDNGERVARYDKIHLFDVTVQGDSKTHYNESRTVEAGDKVVVVDTPGGRLGLAVCYDLRFPELFRAMATNGAEFFTLPSAFTAITGRAHWEILVRARAIENLAYVIAPAQGGYHVNGRETWGESMLVDPWGAVLERLGNASGVVVADMDTRRTRAIRAGFPTLSHIRFGCQVE